MRLAFLSVLAMPLMTIHWWGHAHAQEEQDDEPQGDESEAQSSEDAAEMLEQMDQDGDGKLTHEELIAGIRKLADEDGEDDQAARDEHEEAIGKFFPKSD